MAFLLEEPRSVDDEVGFITLHLTVLLEQDLPLTRLLIPDCLMDGRLQLYIFAKVPFLGRPLDICLDLGLSGIEGGPVRVPFEWENIDI